MIKYLRKHQVIKTISIALTVNLLLELFFPVGAFALTAGPNSPEFSSFEPVATTDMVHPFTGDFTYNLPVVEIPGPDGAGYAMSLSYHSGASIEEEASWVGFGWTLNPGAINRGTRGYPDDYNGDLVKHYNKTIPNWSTSASQSNGLEIKSKDTPPADKPDTTIYTSFATISARKSLRFNNYQGFAREVGMSANVKGIGAGITRSAEGVTFSAGVDLSRIFKKQLTELMKEENSKATKDDKGKVFTKNMRAYLRNKSLSKSLSGMSSSYGSTYGLFTCSEAVRSTTVTAFKGRAFNWSTGMTINPPPVPIGYQTGLTGNFNMQWTLDQDLNAYGYMNTPLASGSGTASDYYVEKGNPYSKRDYYLGVPFNNADNFMVSGEGLSGGFRYYPENVRQFHPTHNASKTTIYQMGVELDVGASIGIGVDFGVGYNKVASKDWGKFGTAFTSEYDNGGSNGAFRFNNDLGGKIEYGNNDIATAKLSKASRMPGAKSAYLDADVTKLNSTYNTAHNGSSSHIQKIGTSKIDGFSITNESGIVYTYGQPLYTRNETALQFDVKKQNWPADNYLAYQETHLRSDYSVDASQHKMVVGDQKTSPYSTACLLTSITSPDYVDVGANGPDNADFGAWTKFDYHKTYGAADWYRWRTPYKGLLYTRGEISTSKDDYGTIQTGEKEVLYLKAIETKTHIAYFITNKTYASRFAALPSDTSFVKGSQKPRLDGLGAWEIAGDRDDAATGSKGNQQLEYLEKIVLFSKSRMDKPLQTVYFDYDYSLVQNLPNNTNGNYPDARTSNNSGKLTLKKVWFEYEGTVSSRISPYEFTYKYKDKTDFPKEILERYPDYVTSNLRYSDRAQNPDYNPHLMDAWGNVQMYGEERQKDLIPWPYQGKAPAQRLADGPLNWRNRIAIEAQGFFDPAAWQLKQIKLPSGGEILIDYEQKDYRFVQDRDAMAMVSILGYDDEATDLTGKKIIDKNPVYYLNLSDIGIDPTDTDFSAKRNELLSKITEYYGADGEKQKIYFKYLYNLSSDASIPGLDQCSSEYITGYAKFKSCEAAAYNGQECIKITLEGENSSDGEYAHVPRRACYDFVATQRIGKVNTESDPQTSNEDCESIYEQQYDALVASAANDDSRKLAKFGIASLVMEDIVGDMKNKDRYQIPQRISVCTAMNPRLSFLKIPMITAKRGGGVRVKRLLMYDPGLETGDAVLYGNEFLYQTEDGKSSGVATTEPSDMREENPLVTFLPRKGQSAFSRITAGQEKEQTEGPIGESILPAASVGHSRVVVKNIHTGKTGTGFAVHEYHTVKDYPYDKAYLDGLGVENTPLSDNQMTDRLSIPAGLFSYSNSKVWATQGFRFIINNMHGQKKKTSTYGGSYENHSEAYLTSSQTYNYYEPGEKVKMIHYSNGQFIVKEDNPGKEMDVAMEMNAVHNNTLDLSIEVDITIGMPTLNVFVGASPTIEVNESIIRTHTTSKVIRYPVLVRSVTSFMDGVTTTTENLAYNRHTGEVAVTRTSDSYDKVKIKGAIHDGYIYNINVPASWIYSQMGQKALNANNTNQLNASAGAIVSYGSLGNPLATSPGDSVLTWFASPENVLASNVQTFSNNWTSSWNDPLINEQFSSSAYASQLNKVWRPHKSYVYKDSIISANVNKTYNSGMFKSYQTYWSNPDNPKWIKANEVTKYSPHGSALEEINVLKVPSAARFGYANNIMPVMIAENADYSSIWFEDYENSGAAQAGIAHSGNKAKAVNSGETIIAGAQLYSASALKQRGGIANFWVKESSDNTNELQLKVQVNASTVAAKKVAQTGDWSLYRAEIPASAFTGSSYTMAVSYAQSATGTIYVDDVRMQPVDSKVTCYVYDVKSLRLITQLDDWHFGMYYQYNDEGKLVRKLVETERGLKTIQETQYNTPKTNRQ